MKDIPNTEYITVKANGIFVGGKPAETYRGEEIWYIDEVKEVFAWMQKQNPEIDEFHIGAFATRGKHAEVGNPSGEFGPNAWCRVKKKGRAPSPWVFHYTSDSAADCAFYCATTCAEHVRVSAAFRSTIENVYRMAKPKNPEIEKLKTVDFSKLPKKPIKLNGYRILVEKISTRTK